MSVVGVKVSLIPDRIRAGITREGQVMSEAGHGLHNSPNGYHWVKSISTQEVIVATTKRAKRAVAKAIVGSKSASPGVRRTPVGLRRGLAEISLYQPQPQVIRLIEILGNNLLAELIGVNQSQPSMWKSGKERVSPENQRKLSDLDHVMNRLLIEMYPEQATQWLQGNNPHLNFARPMDVLVLKGASKVLDAIDALSSGSYA